MKLLWVVPYAPNAIRVRPYEFLRALAARGHALTLATLFTNGAEEADLAALRGFGINVLAAPLTRNRTLWNAARTLPTRIPLQARYADAPALRAAIAQMLAHDAFDAVHVEHLRGAPYALAVADLRQAMPLAARPTLVWDSVDCIALLFAQAAAQSASRKGRWMARLELGRTRRYEGRLARTFDHTVVTAPADAAALQELAGGGAPITVIANGVDLTTFHPPAPDAARAPARIILTGKMSYHANVTAAVQLVQQIMPLVWAQRPDAEAWLVGKDPTPAVRALAAPRVVVTGGVPSIAAALREATVAAAPVAYGVGIQNKVLEAMACATPVVASPQAASALQAAPGRDYLPAADPPAFAAALLALLNDPARAAQVGQAGRAYVERCHTWAGAAAQLEALYVA